MNYAAIKKQVDDIISIATSLDKSGRVRYVIRVHNPSFGNEYMEFSRGSNADNADVQSPRAHYYGAEMVNHFIEDLNNVVNNESNAGVQVSFMDGKNASRGEYEVILREEYARPSVIVAPQKEIQQTQHQQQPAQAPSADLMQGMQSIDSFLGALFQGVGGVEGSGLGAVLNIRDGMNAQRHAHELAELRHEYAEKDNLRRIDALTKEKESLSKMVGELERKVRDYERDIDKKEDTIFDLEERVAELEKMKPENSFMGVALSGALASAGQMLLQKNAKFIGSLAGVDEQTMRGLLSGDAPSAPAPTVNVPDPEVAVGDVEVEVEDENPRFAKVSEIKELMYDLSDDDFVAFWQIVKHLDDNRENLVQIAKAISNNQ